MKLHLPVVLLVGFFFAIAQNLQAANLPVDSPATFQAALIIAQSNGQHDTITVAAGTYTIGSVLQYAPTEDYSLTISGTNRETTVLDGNNTTTIFRAMMIGFPNAQLTIENISFENGSGDTGGALLLAGNSGTVTIRNCKFINNSAKSGGGVAVEVENAVIFTDNIVSGNAATERFGGGVAMFAQNGPLTVTGNQISSNTAAEAAGGFVVSSETGDITFSNNAVTQNTVAGVLAGDGYYAGGSLMNDAGSVVFDNNTIAENTATGILPLIDEAGNIGGVMIQTTSGSMSANGNRFYGNQANNSGGGGAAITASGDILFVNNLVYENTATEMGGGFGLGSATGTIHVINNTITANTATNDFAGGFYLQLGEDATNTASATAYIYNNIIWGNTAGGDGDDIYVNDNEDSDALQGEAYLHFNNFSDLFFGDGAASLESDNVDQDPQFTSDYHIPASSPCVDAGDSGAPELPTVDIDSDSRVIDGNDDGVAVVDMGADEYTDPVFSSGTGGSSGGGGGCFIHSLTTH